jgi:hypothetical protein
MIRRKFVFNSDLIPNIPQRPTLSSEQKPNCLLETRSQRVHNSKEISKGYILEFCLNIEIKIYTNKDKISYKWDLGGIPPDTLGTRHPCGERREAMMSTIVAMWRSMPLMKVVQLGGFEGKSALIRSTEVLILMRQICKTGLYLGYFVSTS